MRVRTGHKPGDWSENVPGAFAHGTGRHGGQLVVAPSAPATHKAIGRRIVPVDPNDYQKVNRWDGKSRCAKIMPKLGEPCARMPGHKDDCRSSRAVARDLERRRKYVA